MSIIFSCLRPLLVFDWCSSLVSVAMINTMSKKKTLIEERIYLICTSQPQPTIEGSQSRHPNPNSNRGRNCGGTRLDPRLMFNYLFYPVQPHMNRLDSPTSVSNQRNAPIDRSTGHLMEIIPQSRFPLSGISRFVPSWQLKLTMTASNMTPQIGHKYMLHLLVGILPSHSECQSSMTWHFKQRSNCINTPLPKIT